MHEEFSWTNTVECHYKAVQSTNLVRYCINNCRNWCRISIRCWTHKRHHIARPNGRATSFICENIDIIMASYCISCFLTMSWLVPWNAYLRPIMSQSITYPTSQPSSESLAHAFTHFPPPPQHSATHPTQKITHVLKKLLPHPPPTNVTIQSLTNSPSPSLT